MFERFSDRSRRVVVLAQEEARHLNHNYIGTEHVLLSLLTEGEGVAAQALASLGVTYDKARAEVEERVGPGGATPRGHIPFTPRAKKVLELALREALHLGHDYIGTEHILLGLIRVNDGVGCQVLVKLGVDLSKVRERLLVLINDAPEVANRYTFTSSMVDQLQPVAFDMARTLGHDQMGTDHLLAALLGQSDSAAVMFLHTEGIDVEGLKTRLESALREAENSKDP